MDEDSQNVTNTPASTDESAASASVILNLEDMIQTHLTSLKTLQEELQKHQGMLDDIFANDPTFKEHSEKAKEAAKLKSQTKQQILKQPQVADLATKVKDMKQETKDLKNALSDYLQEYRRLSGVNEIEHDGEVKEIIYTAKLVNKSFKPMEYKRS